MLKARPDTGHDPITDFMITNLLCIVGGLLIGFAIAAIAF